MMMMNYIANTQRCRRLCGCQTKSTLWTCPPTPICYLLSAIDITDYQFSFIYSKYAVIYKYNSIFASGSVNKTA